jgi:endoglucanase
MKKAWFIVLHLLLLQACAKENNNVDKFDSSKAIVALGVGFNLGNTFDVDSHPTDADSIKGIMGLYKNIGMAHVRIPITWMDGFDGNTMADENGNVDYAHPRFIELKETIDYALSIGLIVIINAHHEKWLKENYDDSDEQNASFGKLWEGIASFFKDYPPTLIFEVLNEPEGNFGDWSGGTDPYDELSISRTRKINEIGYDAIRQSGGNNQDRIIMISPNGQGNHFMFPIVYPETSYLPNNGTDKYLIVQVHSYDPWEFCGQDGSNIYHPGDEEIKGYLQATQQHAQYLGIPVIYGEFGVGRDANPAERADAVVKNYYRYMAQTTVSLGMAATVWDDRGWFGLLEKNAQNEYAFTYNIVPFMLGK